MELREAVLPAHAGGRGDHPDGSTGREHAAGQEPVDQAGLHALDQWLRTGTPPSSAPRFEITPGPGPQLRRDADGIVLGGIRTPPVDVPVDALSGVVGPKASTICLLSGSTKPLPPARLAQLYPSRAAYVRRYNDEAGRAIKSGYVLVADRRALLTYAQPQRIRG